MKAIILGILMYAVLFPCPGSCQAPMSGGDTANQVQWNSHQMNQPAPPKYNLTRERMEDIRRLYDQAIQESRKSKPQTTDPQTPRH